MHLQTLACKKTAFPNRVTKGSFNFRVKEAGILYPNAVIEACQWSYVDSILENRGSTAGNSRQPFFWIDQAVRVGSGFSHQAPVDKDVGFHLENGNRQVSRSVYLESQLRVGS